MSATPKETDAVTQAKSEKSKDMWERLNNLLEESFKHLENWVKDKTFPDLQKLANLLGGDLANHEHLWATMEQVGLVATN